MMTENNNIKDNENNAVKPETKTTGRRKPGAKRGTKPAPAGENGKTAKQAPKKNTQSKKNSVKSVRTSKTKEADNIALALEEESTLAETSDKQTVSVKGGRKSTSVKNGRSTASKKTSPKTAKTKEASKTVEASKTKETSKTKGTAKSGTRTRQKQSGFDIVRSVLAPKTRRSNKKICIIPLGGLEQIGMNITVIETDNSMVIVDCGMAFPDEEMLGIDLVIPDITYLRDNADKIEGFFITHGHEDHIGALPYVLRNLNVPVYATRLTRALIENKLREHGLIESAKLNTVQYGDVIKAGDFAVEFIKTNHSIQDAAALAIHSPAGVVLHTGDFKVDYTPVFGDTIDLQRFAELGKQGVLALLCDSTNATRQGFTMSEKTVGHTFEGIFGENKDKRIIVATFASNVDRVQQIISVAEEYDRKVVIDGRSMINVISTASELGYIKMKENTLIDISEIKNYPDDKIVLIVTGSQGEPMAALSRMATGQHRKVQLSEHDLIVLSSTPIPGNEKAVSKVINELSRKGTKVIYQDTHVSGHACAEELKLIYTLVHPKFSIPVHGELRHRLAQKEVAIAIGMPKENCHLVDTGDVVELTQDSCKVVDKVQAGPILVDGLGIGDVGNAVLKDRQSMSQNGIIVAAVSVEKATGEFVAGPEILTRGLVYVKENEDIIDEARDVVLRVMDDCRGMRDLNRVKNTIRNELSDYVWRRIQRTPMILAVITEV